MKKLISLAVGLSMVLCSTTAFAQLEAGHVQFKEQDSAVSAEVLVTDLADSTQATLFLAAYDGDGKLTGIQSVSGTNAILSTGSLPSGADSYKAYVWEANTVKPLQNVATKGSSNADLAGILLNGQPLDGFDASTLSYNVKLTVGNAVMPRITATAADNGSAVTIKEEVAGDGTTATAAITVTPQTGDAKVYTINYSIDGAGAAVTHAIRGAESDEDFEAKTNYSSEQKFNTTAVATSATNDGPFTENKAMIATNFYANPDFAREGAAAKADRTPLEPLDSKFQIYKSTSDELNGLDYIVFPHGGTGFAKFTLAAPAEVIIASQSEVTGLDGFESTSGYGTVTFLFENRFNAATVYSLMKEHGLTADDFVQLDTGSQWYRFSNLDTDKASLAGAGTKAEVDSLKGKTTAEIEAAVNDPDTVIELTDGGDVVLNPWTSLTKVYSKSYSDVGADGTEVVIPYTGQCLAFIKPISGSDNVIVPAVSDYQYVGPKTWAEVTALIDESEYGDNAGKGQNQILVAENYGALGKLANKTAAFTDYNREINNINSVFGLEGKDFLVPSWTWIRYTGWFTGLYTGNPDMSGGSFVSGAQLPAVDWVSFDLNRDATVIVVPMSSGTAAVPTFIDDSWTLVKYADGRNVSAFERWFPNSNSEGWGNNVYMKEYSAGNVTLPVPQLKTNMECFIIID